ncbi:MAG: mannose-6-phosphate isomerase [Actinobacteria bacterium]|nr:mannose-6-phosphate isomerase [Actinomycetota bacterium]MCB8996387.1 mannose-6-phosphate isomerase [Actinomycetota bacterium]MCB9414906.1 mannose-6-phosphate isomerase [Actinomycetota bacterium]HRY09809.1 SIS domain-containing protein [Candidatus Nanopelagicales bacterium]
MSVDDTLLDEPDELVGIDSQRMLASTASAGAAIRSTLDADDGHALGPLVEQGRPRSLCVVGAGGSSAPGEVLAAVAGRGSPLPVFALGGPALPGWVGPMDLVVAVSASGRTPEILTFVSEAQRRGSSVLGIGAANSPLQEVCSNARGVSFWPVSRLSPLQDVQKARSLLWALSAPLLLLAGELGIVAEARDGLAGAADRLDARALECGVEVLTPENPAKDLSIHLTSGLPLAWGSGDVGAVAARRLGRQLAENADWPSVVGVLPEGARTHAGLLGGPWAAPAREEDIFRDRTLDSGPQPRLRAVLLRDAMEHPDTATIADAVVQTCERLDVPCQELTATSGHAIEQLADLVGLVDFASIYTALMQRRDPSHSAEDIDPRFGRWRRTEGR